ncbi:unnamed protein product, partial [Phaeothamnion confervicola]
IYCSCTHLTDFGSQFGETAGLASTVLSQKITLGDIMNSMTVLITLLVIYGAFIFGCIWGRYLDRKERLADMRANVTGVGLDGLPLQPDKKEVLLQLSTGLIAARRYWEGLKQNHRLLSVYFLQDRVFTRPQRLMVLLCVLMGQLFTNAILYMQVGSAKDASVGERLQNMVFFAVMAVICGSPIGIILVLLFKRTGRQ